MHPAVSAVRLNVSEALKVPANTVECLIGMANKLLKADDNITVIVATLAPIDMTPALRIIPLVGTLIGSMNTGIKAVRVVCVCVCVVCVCVCVCCMSLIRACAFLYFLRLYYAYAGVMVAHNGTPYSSRIHLRVQRLTCAVTHCPNVLAGRGQLTLGTRTETDIRMGSKPVYSE